MILGSQFTTDGGFSLVSAAQNTRQLPSGSVPYQRQLATADADFRIFIIKSCRSLHTRQANILENHLFIAHY